MKKQIIIITMLVLSFCSATGQNNVGIGTTNPDASSILELQSDSKGLLITRLTTIQRNAMSAGLTVTQKGLLVFDKDESLFYFWDGSQWVAVGSGGSSGCSTLQQAYDCGGAGAGRQIDAANGPFQVNLTSFTNNLQALYALASVGNSSSITAAIAAEQTSVAGVSVYAENSNSANPYSTIYASSNSSTAYTSAVSGYYEGNAQGVGIYGSVASSTSAGVAGVMGINARTNGGYGMLGQGFTGVVGETNYQVGAGVWGQNNDAIGSGNGCGVVGSGNYGVWGQISYGQAGTFGMNARTDGGWGVEGQGVNGVVGFTVNDLGFGLYGENMSTGVVNDNIGVAGLGWVGVFGESNNLGGAGYGVYSNGMFGSSGTKSFMIDHPLDPENKFLKHYTVESPEVLNMYRGTAVLDAGGEAEIILPDYFASININYSYHLTAVGAPMPGLYVKNEISQSRLTVAGGVPGAKVSWTVYAERNDPYLQHYPEARQVVTEKRSGQKGKYLMPELYNQPADKKLFVPLNAKKQDTITPPVSGNEKFEQPKMKK
jgi:hypothetical protein